MQQLLRAEVDTIDRDDFDLRKVIWVNRSLVGCLAGQVYGDHRHIV